MCFKKIARVLKYLGKNKSVQFGFGSSSDMRSRSGGRDGKSSERTVTIESCFSADAVTTLSEHMFPSVYRNCHLLHHTTKADIALR